MWVLRLLAGAHGREWRWAATGSTSLVPHVPCPCPGPHHVPCPLTGAAELVLLDLSHVEAAQLGRSRALGEEPDGGALAQPLREPGQVAVAEEMVGMQAAAGGRSSQQPQDSSPPPHCPRDAPAWLLPKPGGVQREIQRGLRVSVTVAKATWLGSTWGCSAGVSPPVPPRAALPALLSHQHQQQSWGHPTSA